MGNSLKGKKAHEEKSKAKGVIDTKTIYWDIHGNLRHGDSTRNRDEEILRMIAVDNIKDDSNSRLWLVIPSLWIRNWLLFVYHKSEDEPGAINTYMLLTKTKSTEISTESNDNTVVGGWRVKETLQPPIFSDDNKTLSNPGHYRRISLRAWLVLLDLYSCHGPAIAVRGSPADDMTRWRLFSNPRDIDMYALPVPPSKDVPGGDSKSKSNNKLNETLANVTSFFDTS